MEGEQGMKMGMRGGRDELRLAQDESNVSAQVESIWFVFDRILCAHKV